MKRRPVSGVSSRDRALGYRNEVIGSLLAVDVLVAIGPSVTESGFSRLQLLRAQRDLERLAWLGWRQLPTTEVA